MPFRTELQQHTMTLEPSSAAGLDPLRPVTARELDAIAERLQMQLEWGVYGDRERQFFSVLGTFREALDKVLEDLELPLPKGADGVNYKNLIDAPIDQRLKDSIFGHVLMGEARSTFYMVRGAMNLYIGLRKSLGNKALPQWVFDASSEDIIKVADLRRISSRMRGNISNLCHRFDRDLCTLAGPHRNSARRREAYRQIGQWICDQRGTETTFAYTVEETHHFSGIPKLRVIEGGKG